MAGYCRLPHSSAGRSYRVLRPLWRAALDAPAPNQAVIESVAEFMRRVASIEWLNCPHCGEGRFVVVEALPPSPLPRPPPQGPP